LLGRYIWLYDIGEESEMNEDVIIVDDRKGMSSAAKQEGERLARIMDEGPHPEAIKMLWAVHLHEGIRDAADMREMQGK
jgi:hypothetical protein